MWMAAEVTPNYDSQWAAIVPLPRSWGVGTAETVRKWVRQAEVDAGQRRSAPRNDQRRVGRAEAVAAGERRAAQANEILKAGS